MRRPSARASAAHSSAAQTTASTDQIPPRRRSISPRPSAQTQAIAVPQPVATSVTGPGARRSCFSAGIAGSRCSRGARSPPPRPATDSSPNRYGSFGSRRRRQDVAERVEAAGDLERRGAPARRRGARRVRRRATPPPARPRRWRRAAMTGLQPRCSATSSGRAWYAVDGMQRAPRRRARSLRTSYVGRRRSSAPLRPAPARRRSVPRSRAVTRKP